MLLELKNSCHFKIFPKMRQSLKITQLATLAPMWSHWLLLPPLLTVTMKATFVGCRWHDEGSATQKGN